jgi:hypothetical protein
MAITALNAAASGLSALTTRLDVLSNNIANVNTNGFKASRTSFADLLYEERELPGTENSIGDRNPTGLYVGLGVRVTGTQLDFTQGSLRDTGRDLVWKRVAGLGSMRTPARGRLRSTRMAIWCSRSAMGGGWNRELISPKTRLQSISNKTGMCLYRSRAMRNQRMLGRSSS